MAIRSFDPSQVLVSLSGFTLTGLADGSFVSIVRNNDYFVHVPGIRNKHTRKRVRDRSGIIQIRLMQTHPDNEVLSRIVMNDDFNLTGLLSVLIKDLSGQDEFQFDNAYIAGPPNVSYTASGTTASEWTINYEYTTYNHVGGNDLPTVDFENPFGFQL